MLVITSYTFTVENIVKYSVFNHAVYTVVMQIRNCIMRDHLDPEPEPHGWRMRIRIKEEKLPKRIERIVNMSLKNCFRWFFFSQSPYFKKSLKTNIKSNIFQVNFFHIFVSFSGRICSPWILIRIWIWIHIKGNADPRHRVTTYVDPHHCTVLQTWEKCAESILGRYKYMSILSSFLSMTTTTSPCHALLLLRSRGRGGGG